MATDKTKEELSAIGKMFFGNVFMWLIKGSKLNFKLKGDEEVVKAFTKALFAAKRLQEVTNDPRANIQTISDSLNLKRAAIEEFEQLAHRKFPL